MRDVPHEKKDPVGVRTIHKKQSTLADRTVRTIRTDPPKGEARRASRTNTKLGFQTK